jgi:ribosomal protein S18 acetylase RimI-like enzyme
MAGASADSLELRGFGFEDYEAAIELWKRCPGVGLSSADGKPEIATFLEKNPGLCFAAWAEGRLAGTSLCGSDGRRGYLYHVAVDPARRGRGIGRALAEASLAGLSRAGIKKCHLFVLADNEAGSAFWRAIGWTGRDDIYVFSKDVVV